MERISGKRIVAPKAKAAAQSKPNLLIDIQTRMQQIDSPGSERWAKIFDLKEMAQTVTCLQENGLTDFEGLEKVCDATVHKFNDLSDQTKAASARMKDISELQRRIGAYGKTREIYAQYRKLTGRKQDKFYEQHTSEITACQAAKRRFDSLGLKTAVYAIAETGICSFAGRKQKTVSRVQAGQRKNDRTAHRQKQRGADFGRDGERKDRDRQQEAR